MAGWLWHARSKLRSAEADQSRIDGLFEEATNCCLVLMLFTPAGSIPPIYVPKRRQHSPSGSPSSGSRPAARRRWRKAVIVVCVIIRWRAVVSSRMLKDTVAAVPRFVRTMLRRNSKAEEQPELSKREGGRPVVSDNASVGCLLVLLVLVMDNHQRAVARTSGVRSFCALVGLVRTRSLLADILLPLAPAMQTPQLVERHILSHLGAVGSSVTHGVTAAFQALYSEILRLLKQCYQSWKGERTEGPSPTPVSGRVATCGELGQTNKSESSMPRCFDARTMLLLLEVWGLTIRPEDWRFMETVGVIGAISHVSAAPFAVNEAATGGGRYGEPAREDEVASRKWRASQRQEKSAASNQKYRSLATCRAAAWTLFRVLVIQLHRKTSNIRVVENDPPQLNSIFEVLRTELSMCITKAKSKASAAPRELECGGRNRGVADRQCRDRTPSQAILEFATPLIGGFPDSPQHGRGIANGRVYRTGPSHKRRCQELVSGPRRLMNMEDGLIFPAEHVLSNPRSSDFSITFWLRLAQDRTGHHRTVLARGNGSERWPVVLLRNTDNRLEVRTALKSGGFTDFLMVCTWVSVTNGGGSLNVNCGRCFPNMQLPAFG